MNPFQTLVFAILSILLVTTQRPWLVNQKKTLLLSDSALSSPKESGTKPVLLLMQHQPACQSLTHYPFFLNKIFLPWCSNSVQPFICAKNILRECTKKLWELDGSSRMSLVAAWGVREVYTKNTRKCFPVIPEVLHWQVFLAGQPFISLYSGIFVFYHEDRASVRSAVCSQLGSARDFLWEVNPHKLSRPTFFKWDIGPTHLFMSFLVLLLLEPFPADIRRGRVTFIQEDNQTKQENKESNVKITYTHTRGKSKHKGKSPKLKSQSPETTQAPTGMHTYISYTYAYRAHANPHLQSTNCVFYEWIH